MLERKNKEETKFTLLGGAWEENDQETGKLQEENIKRLEKYTYYDADKICRSLELPEKALQDGKIVYKQGRVTIQEINSGFDPDYGESRVNVEAQGNTGRESFPIKIIFSRDCAIYTQCYCPECRKSFYGWYSSHPKCKYMAALGMKLKDILQNQNIGDATDMKGSTLLGLYEKKRSQTLLAKAQESEEETVTLVPRLTKKNEKLSVSFKVGTGKLFVVKKLDEFCKSVKDGAVATYGSNTQISHQLSSFTKKSRKWISYIERIVKEEERFVDKMEDAGYYLPKKFSVGGSLELFGWRLDSFYDTLGEEKAEFEDKSEESKKKSVISCGTGDPKVTMNIRANEDENGNFHGVDVDGELPELFYGMDRAYYVDNDKLYKTEADFREKINPLAGLASRGRFSFTVGRNSLSRFYHNALPRLEELADITETEPEKFRAYLSPEAHFIFYLDAELDNVTCEIRAHYGSREYSVTENLVKDHISTQEQFRDYTREEEILQQAMQWLPFYDAEYDVLHCDSDEESVYRVMDSGVEALMALGEVRCTSQFRNRHVIKKVKVSVGVSVSSGLLDLNISTEDISGRELLDILKSYRAKKKYFKLKSGEFVNLEEPSLGMLSEMMESLQLSPKEFVKGKMHIPAYRTLYLDQMLEANDSVYSRRDRHFRDIVKGFKTINDADFEEPASLSGIMRKYQKNGFKWLRTLEAWKFGGILADDMGLGKTLQVIAVMLSAKEEGRKGTSLVVAPAALVYNWGEELARFAPQLKVSLITGTQGERQKKLSQYQESDVLVTSYDLLKRDIDQYEDMEFLYQIIDEAQYIKNHTTAAAKAVKVIKSQTRYALTGTPIENRLSELWSIFDYLMPGFLYGYDVFRREFETPIVKNGDQDTMARLQKMTGPFILRRLKGDVLKDLPEKLEEIRYVKFDKEQQKLYDGQVLHMKESIAKQDAGEFNKNKMLILAELTRLRQICCSPSLCFENYRGESAKLEACMQLIQSAMDSGHRMLLFSQFTSMLAIVQAQLEEQKIPYYIITGETPKQKRLELVKEFNEGDVPVFLISLKAGGVGLNLTGADVVIHYDPWWNQAVQNQATDRAHRIGQTRKVTVYKLIAKNSIEEKIQKLQETKRDLAEQVISGETGQLGSMSKEELLELLES